MSKPSSESQNARQRALFALVFHEAGFEPEAERVDRIAEAARGLGLLLAPAAGAGASTTRKPSP